MKILRNFMIYLWFNLYLICISLPKKIQIRRSRFDYESESDYYSSCKNHESESEYSGFGGKDSNPNPNPNIRYNTGAKLCCAPALLANIERARIGKPVICKIET